MKAVKSWPQILKLSNGIFLQRRWSGHRRGTGGHPMRRPMGRLARHPLGGPQREDPRVRPQRQDSHSWTAF